MRDPALKANDLRNQNPVPSSSPASPGITVIIPTLDRGRFLVDTVQDLLKQDHRPMEILIVDQSEATDPEIARIAQANPELISYHHVKFRGLPIARNFGWQHARHEIVLYIDDDIRCESRFVSEHARAFTSPDIAVVGGAIDEPTRNIVRDRLRMDFDPWTATPYDGGFHHVHEDREADHAKGGNFAVRKQVLRALGGFDENLGIGAALHEETEFCLRVREHGGRIRFAHRARLTHLAAPSGGCRVPDLRRYIWSLAHNRSILIRRHLGWLHRPTAALRLALLCLSYTIHHRSPRLLWAGVRGFVSGCVRGGQAPRQSRWE